MKYKKVNFFVVGHGKCGSTILYEYFKKHPSVEVPKKKEIKFFCKDQFREDELNKIFFNVRKLKEYHSLFDFDKSKEYYADFSPQYVASSVAAKEIYHYNSKAKILILFREPVSYLKSIHKQLIQNCEEDVKDLKKALELENKRKKEKFIPPYTRLTERIFYSERIKYAKQLKRFLDVFPKEQIKVVIYEDFKKDNQKIMNELCDFLDIKRIKIQRENVNLETDVRLMKLRSFLLKNSILRKFAKIVMPIYFRKKIVNFINRITVKFAKKSLSCDFKKELMKKYKPEVVKLNKLLHEHELIEQDKDLVKFWGYGKV